MKISTSQFKNGLKIIISGQPCSIIEHEFHKPGKGQAVMRVKFRNLMTDKVIDKTYKSGESVEEADVSTVEMSYLYSDGDFWHFMNSTTFEQIGITEKVVADAKKWLIGQETCEVVIWNDEPITVEGGKRSKSAAAELTDELESRVQALLNQHQRSVVAD